VRDRRQDLTADEAARTAREPLARGTQPRAAGASWRRLQALAALACLAALGLGVARLDRLDAPAAAVRQVADDTGASVTWLVDGPSALAPERPRIEARFVMARFPVALHWKRRVVVLADGAQRVLPGGAAVVLVTRGGGIEPLYCERPLPGSFVSRVASRPPDAAWSSWLTDWLDEPSNSRALGQHAARIAAFWRE
jgi:hypothetical protein